MVLAMTHEEIVTFHVAQVVRSYRDLPLILYHFQTKERDEPRPRAGVLRTREFIMKDAYTFDRDARGARRRLRASTSRAYDRIFDRARARVVPRRVRRRDDGRLRRARVHGAVRGGRERRRARARLRRQRRDRERRRRSRSSCRRRSPSPSWSRRPGMTTVAAVAGELGVPAGALLKAFPVIVDDAGSCSSCCAATTASTRSSCATRSGAEFRPAQRGGVRGPHRARRLHRPGRRRRADPARRRGVGAGRLRHRRQPPGRAPARRRAGPRLPVRARRRPHASRPATPSTATRSGSSRRSRSATSSSSARATPSRSARPTSTRPASAQPIWMGSYGIGPARIAAAAVEQFADEQGIAWPRSIAPFDVELVGLGKDGHARSASWPSGSTTSCARPGSTCSTTTATPARGEVRRRRAARRAAAAHGRAADARGRARSRRRCGAAASSAPCRSRAPPRAAADLWRSLP